MVIVLSNIIWLSALKCGVFDWLAHSLVGETMLLFGAANRQVYWQSLCSNLAIRNALCHRHCLGMCADEEYRRPFRRPTRQSDFGDNQGVKLLND